MTVQPALPTEALWAERVGDQRYDGRNSSGAVVRMGLVAGPDVFTPTELLKIALAGCVGLTADHPLTHRLGQQVPVRVRVSGPKDATQQRFCVLTEELHVDLSTLETVDRERLIRLLRRAVDNHCTVGRTLEHGADVDLAVLNTAVVDTP